MSEWTSDSTRQLYPITSSDPKGHPGYDDEFLSRTYPHPLDDESIQLRLWIWSSDRFTTVRTHAPLWCGELTDPANKSVVLAVIPQRLHNSTNPAFVVVDFPRRTFTDELFGNSVIFASNGYTPISGPPGWNSEPIRIYAGQPVPGDKSRFTCKLETPTQIGRLEGQLVDADTGHGFKLNLTVHLDGPNPNPPTSQPAPTTLPSTIPATP
jgi:hypothetical protein